MTELKKHSYDNLERVAIKATRWIGSTNSLIVHTGFFLVSFVLCFFGFDLNKVLLVVTTLVSFEAIYLSIFIQMSVNRQTRRLREVARDVEEIAEDVEGIQEDVEGIEKDVDAIQKDVDEIQEDVEEIAEDVEELEENVDEISEEMTEEDTSLTNKDNDIVLARIEYTLGKLMTDIEDLKKAHPQKKIISKQKK